MSVISLDFFKAASTFKKITPPTDKKFQPLKHTATSKEVTCSEYYLLSILDSFKQKFGFNYMGWFEAHNQNIDFLSTYPEPWLNRYINNNYQKKDKVIKNTLTNLNPFFWSSSANEYSFTEDQEALNLASHYGLRSGITFPLAFSENRIAGLSFSSPKSIDEFKETLESKVNDLMLLSHLFHMVLKAHQAGIDDMEDTHKAFSFYRGNLQI